MHDRRVDITFGMIASCYKALSKLGKSNSLSLKAWMDHVQELYVDPAQHGLLTSRYYFKQVKVDKRFKPRVKLFQVRLGGGKYRALLFFWDDAGQAIWLDVFVKDPASQQARIQRAAMRASEIVQRSK